MIICDDRKFAFIHIPKCAGTSVRHALRPFDTTGEAFFRIDEHPAMGAVHLAHLTLADLARYFPDTFDKVICYRSMAIVRDPVDRFYSAVFQRLREFKEIAQSAITQEKIEAEAHGVIAYLENTPGRLDLEHVHFNRQCDFIELAGESIVRNVFPVADMAGAVRHIESLSGVNLDIVQKNPTTELRFGALRPMQRMLRARYARMVPADRRARIRERMTRAGFYKAVPKQQFLDPDGPIDRFIRDYYARDFEIVEQCTKPIARVAS